MFDKDYEEASSSVVYDFIEVNSVVAVFLPHTSEPFFLINVTEKAIAKDTIKDRFGHIILEGKQFLRSNYLKKTHISNIYLFRF